MNNITAEVLAKFNFDQAAEIADLLDLYTTDKDELIGTATDVLNTLLSDRDATYIMGSYFRASYEGYTGIKLEFIPLDACGWEGTKE